MQLRFLLSLAFLALCAAQPAAAANFAVDSTADAVDAAPGDGVCAAAGGACTLRAAVMEANALAGADAIDLPAGAYVLTLAGAGEELAATGDLDVREGVTITGAGADVTAIDGGALDRVLHLILFSAEPVTVRDLTLTGGSAIASSLATGDGGGALMESYGLNVLFERVVFADNHAEGQGGGLFCYYAGTCTARACTFVGNDAPRGGAAAWINGTLRIEDSDVTGNASPHGAVANDPNANGGLAVIAASNVSGNASAGVDVGGSNVTITDSLIADNAGSGAIIGEGASSIVRTTIRGNVASAGGGILYVNGGSGALAVFDSAVIDNESLGDGGGINAAVGLPFAIRNSTVSGNRAAGQGGGIFLSQWLWALGLEISNVTVTGNTAAEGGGIARVMYGVPEPTQAIRNTVVAGNVAASAPDCLDLGPDVASAGSNLIGDATGCAWVAATGDQLGTSGAPIDARLSPLVPLANGTFGHGALAGSPLVDRGDACLATDQRGELRPLDADDVPGARCDIGALEKRPPTTGGCGLGAELAGLFGALAMRRRSRH